MLATRVALRSARVAAPRASFAVTRGYAEAAKSSVDSRPPVALYGLDGTYASALVWIRRAVRRNMKGIGN